MLTELIACWPALLHGITHEAEASWLDGKKEIFSQEG